MNVVRAAVIQDAPVVFNQKATLEKVHSLVLRASKEGAKLVVLPEAFVSAYPAGLDFGARIGSRTPEGREDFKRYYESAVEVPGPACDALGKAAQEAEVFLVIGVIERDGGTLYCTAHRSGVFRVLDSQTGAELSRHTANGDAAVDPAGARMYRRMEWWDISSDPPVSLGRPAVPEEIYGENVSVTVSGDGQRISIAAAIYTPALVRLGQLAVERYRPTLNDVRALSRRGELAATDTEVYDAVSGRKLGALAVNAELAAFSGDDSWLYLYDAKTRTLSRVAVSNYASVSPSGFTLFS